MNFRFAHPAALLLLLLPVVMILALRLDWRRLATAALLYSDTRLVEGLVRSWRVRLRWLPNLLRAAAWGILVFALARPQSGQSLVALRGEGIDMVLALDISGSMAAPDFAPQNRLEAARTVISSFIAGRAFDRIGLVVFAREAFHQAPPTLDYEVLQRLLSQVKLAPEFNLDDGTAIGMGLVSSANMLRSSAAASRVIILLTDGANNAGAVDPLTAARVVRAMGIRVYTVGVGRVQGDWNTSEGAADLDEDSLQKIAQITSGAYFRAADLIDLQRIYSQIDQLERSEVERQVSVRWQDQGHVWLWIALVALAAERLLRHTVFQAVP